MFWRPMSLPQRYERTSVGQRNFHYEPVEVSVIDDLVALAHLSPPVVNVQKKASLLGIASFPE